MVEFVPEYMAVVAVRKLSDLRLPLDTEAALDISSKVDENLHVLVGVHVKMNQIYHSRFAAGRDVRDGGSSVRLEGLHAGT